VVAEEVFTGLAVAATVLGARPFHFVTKMEPHESGPLQFVSPQQIVVLAPVKLMTADRLWLGHVMECRAEGDGWRTTMLVEHWLHNLPELLNLAARFE